MATSYPRAHMLKALSKMVINTFADFVGEVQFVSADDNKVVLTMTDYTDNPLIPVQGSVGWTAVLVTLWDEHAAVAKAIGVAKGHFLLLKNLHCCPDRHGQLQLVMRGFREGSRGYRIQDPIVVLEGGDSLLVQLQVHRAQRYFGPHPSTPPSVAQIHLNTAGSSTPPPRSAASGASAQLPALLAPKSEPKPEPIPVKVQPSPEQQPRRQVVPPAPTRILVDQLKDAGRACTQGILQYIQSRVRVIGYDPPDVADFSRPVCSFCSFARQLPMKEKTSLSSCSSCGKSNAFQYQFQFVLQVMDDIGQRFHVHVEGKQGVILLGMDAGNFHRGTKAQSLNLLKDRLRRIGVGVVPGEDGPISFDCCLSLPTWTSPTSTHPSRTAIKQDPELEKRVAIGMSSKRTAEGRSVKEEEEAGEGDVQASKKRKLEENGVGKEVEKGRNCPKVLLCFTAINFEK